MLLLCIKNYFLCAIVAYLYIICYFTSVNFLVGMDDGRVVGIIALCLIVPLCVLAAV